MSKVLAVETESRSKKENNEGLDRKSSIYFHLIMKCSILFSTLNT